MGDRSFGHSMHFLELRSSERVLHELEKPVRSLRMKVRRDRSESWTNRPAFEPRRDVPVISEPVLHGRRSLAVHLVHRLMQRGCAGCQGAFVNGIAIADMDMDAEREALV